MTEKVLEIKLMMVKLMNKSLTKKTKSNKELIERHRENLVISVLLTFRLSLQSIRLKKGLGQMDLPQYQRLFRNKQFHLK